MTETQARRHLRQMLRSLTPGSVLQLLSELFMQHAKRARRKGNQKTERQAQEVAATLFVVGLGVDAASPR
jgi:hypothetical protein